MIRLFTQSIFPVAILLCILVSCGENPLSQEPSETTWQPITEDVNGILSTVENMRVLKLYGSHYEMGYAHGYLLGPEIFERQESNLAQEGILELYENQVLPNIQQVHFPSIYYEEIRGNFEGVTARTTNGTIYSSVLERVVDFNDALALNALNAFASQGMCSSFSAWGGITQTGEVLTGYNHDCALSNNYTGKWLIIVRVPDQESGAIPSVCAGMAGELNIHTGMNSTGVTLTCHAINSPYETTSTDGFTSEGIIFRKLTEYVNAGAPPPGIKNILNVLYGIESEALMMSWPYVDSGTRAVAVEIDGNLSQNHGFSLRYPDNNRPYIMQTNHFWLRYPPPDLPCDRYAYLEDFLSSIASGHSPVLSVDTAWNLLAELPREPGVITEIAVVFEPVEKRMHVAFAEPGTNAHECNRVTLSIEELTRIQ
jgi:hypothetical protein